MEIQAMQHNENLVRSLISSNHQNLPDFTLGSEHSSFRADLKPSILVRGTLQLLVCSLAPILTAVAVFAQTFVSFYFAVSTANEALISAFGLGTAFLRLFGYNVVFAFNNNLLTLISQTHGAHDPYTVGVHFHRGLFFQIPLYLLFIVAAYFAHPIFHFLGIDIDDEIITNAITFIQYSAPSVFFSGIFDVCRIYLCGQNYFGLPFYVKLFVAALNGILSSQLISKLGIQGLALANNISELLGVIIIFICMNNLSLSSWIKPSFMALSKLGEYTKFAFSGGLALYLHFLYIEILMFFVSSLNDRAAMSAHVSFVNLRPLMFAIPLGTSVSVTSFVGQCIGEHAKKKAQTAALMGVIACNLYFAIQIVAEYFLLSPMRRLLSISDVNEIEFFNVIFNLYIFWIIFLESHQFMFTGIIKGIGKLHENIKFYMIGFYCVGIPLIYALAKLNRLTLTTIWITYLVSNLVVCILQVRYIFKLDWNTLITNPPIGIDNDIELPLIKSMNNFNQHEE